MTEYRHIKVRLANHRVRVSITHSETTVQVANADDTRIARNGDTRIARNGDTRIAHNTYSANLRPVSVKKRSFRVRAKVRNDG